MNNSIPAVLMSQRKACAYSQNDVAKRVGVGRTTIVAIENGHIERVAFGTVDAYAKVVNSVLDAQPVSCKAEIDRIEMQKVRLEHLLLLEKRKSRHLKLALTLNRKLILAAQKQVELWRSSRACSHFYIDRWQNILSGSRNEIAKKLMECVDSEWGNALVQNTPFIEGIAQ